MNTMRLPVKGEGRRVGRGCVTAVVSLDSRFSEVISAVIGFTLV